MASARFVLYPMIGQFHPVIWPIQYMPRNMYTVFALLCFVVVKHWLISPYPSGLLHWHCGNLTIAPVPAKQPWWIWINTLCEFIMNDCTTTTKQSTTKPCAYFLGYTVASPWPWCSVSQTYHNRASQIAKFIGPTWGPPGSCRPQMGLMLSPWTLLSGQLVWANIVKNISWGVGVAHCCQEINIVSGSTTWTLQCYHHDDLKLKICSHHCSRWSPCGVWWTASCNSRVFSFPVCGNNHPVSCQSLKLALIIH